MHWNTHSRSLPFTGTRRDVFSIVLVGNQVADSVLSAVGVFAGGEWRRRPAADRPGHGRARPAAGRLAEPGPGGGDLGFGSELGERGRLERHLPMRAPPEPGARDVP